MNTDWVKKYIFDQYTEENVFEKRVENFVNMKLPHLQMPLFRYNSFNSDNLSNLKNEVFYLQNPIKFNDPFDCCIGFGMKNIKRAIISSLMKEFGLPVITSVKELERVYNEAHGTSFNFDEQINDLDCNFPNQIKEFASDYIGISCLSEDYKSILMWSHYADKHTGFCVEYNFSMDSFDPNYDDVASRIQIFPVIYSSERPNMSELFDFEVFKQIQINPNESDKFRAGIEYNLLFKAKEWEYEKEWRIVGSVKTSRFYNSPHPKAIYLGVSISDENKEKILEIAKEKKIPVYQMKLSEDKYEFDKPELIN